MYGWILLSVAIVLEVAGTTSMKFADGFSRFIPSILIFVFYGISFVFFTFALKTINVSTAYAIWAGVGTALITIIGFLYFKEPVSAVKILCIIVIIGGVVGLKLAGDG